MILTAFTRFRSGWLLAWLPFATAIAAPLPEPLSFEAALITATNLAHYELVDIDQRMLALRSELGIEQSNSGFRVDLKGHLREVAPSDTANGGQTNDSMASLILSKPLYDFGQRAARENYLALQLQALEHQKRLLVERRRLAIMEKYFAVLNADNRFISENEALAIGYIRFNNAREDLELGQVAEIDVLRLQSNYERIRQQRNFAIQQQRLTRAILAEAMGYPDHLSSDLETPEFEPRSALHEDIEAIVQQAMNYSHEALLANTNTLVSQAAIGIAAATDNGSLELEFEVSEYQRESRLRDDWRASLYFDIPIYSGSTTARVGLAQAEHGRALAIQHQMQSNLRLEVLELWQQVQQLQLELQGRIVEQDYRDRTLDRSRAEYELEFKTDLGDSMVLYSHSNTERLRALYALELAYQRLASLVGADFLNQIDTSQ